MQNYTKFRRVEARVVSCGRTDLTDVVVALRYVANARGRGIWLTDAVFDLTSEAGPMWLRPSAFTALSQRLIVLRNL